MRGKISDGVFDRYISSNTANPLGKVFIGPNIKLVGMSFNIYLTHKDSWFGFTSEAQEHFSTTEIWIIIKLTFENFKSNEHCCLEDNC